MIIMKKYDTETAGIRYENTVPAVFGRRLNRFVAEVRIEGKTERVHVKNTGRLRELLVPGAEVYLTEPGTPGRKTRYDLVTVRKENGEIAATGHTMHCFVKTDFKPMSLKRAFPDYYRMLLEHLEKPEQE